ncbi:hypothetical protein [[Clostridium] innocuum]
MKWRGNAEHGCEMERLGYDGNDMRRKGHAATGNGKEWTRGGWNSDG